MKGKKKERKATKNLSKLDCIELRTSVINKTELQFT